MAEERLAVLEALRRTEQYFRKAGIPSARLDAEVLLAFVLKVPRIRLYAGFDRPLAPPELESYRTLVRRRADREPVAYLTGTKEFHSFEFRVTPDVLVPRPETEHLVDVAVEVARGLPAPRLLDVGTGSGAIAVAWARAVPVGTFVATDVSEAALAVAKENAERAGVAGRGEFAAGDLYEAVGDRGPFDVIASNPPYVGSDEDVDPECRREPAGAIFAGADPTVFYRRLAEGAPARLRPGGHFLLELPGARADEIRALLPAALSPLPVVKDFGGRPRVLVARLPAPPAGETGPA